MRDNLIILQIWTYGKIYIDGGILFKTVKFIPFSQVASEDKEYPRQATKSIPKWFKDIKPFLNGDKSIQLVDDFRINVTVKRCMPFTDSLSLGYTITLKSDIIVEIDEKGNQAIRWRSDRAPIEESSGCMIAAKNNDVPIPHYFSDHLFKWHHDWVIKTPKGYSTYYTHPINRMDLPFHTLTGIVDTDKYDNPVIFPFVLQKDFLGVIRAGTPIVQFFMVKRESWTSRVMKFNQKLVDQTKRKVSNSMGEYYRRNFWTKKEY